MQENNALTNFEKYTRLNQLDMDLVADHEQHYQTLHELAFEIICELLHDNYNDESTHAAVTSFMIEFGSGANPYWVKAMCERQIEKEQQQSAVQNG